MGRKKLENPKGNNYKRPCANCAVPCFGRLCRACEGMSRRKQGLQIPVIDLRWVAPKRNGARNPEWGSGENGKFAVVITKPEYPTHSWWIAQTREDFAAAFQRELPRMMAVKVSGTPHVNTVFD